MIPAQDFSNLPKQQKGLHAKGFEFMRLSTGDRGADLELRARHRRLPRRAALRATRSGDTEDQHHDRRADREPGAYRAGADMVNWDESVDLLIVGSGGGGMVAALAAIDAGIEPLVVEKQGLVGGIDRIVWRHGVAAEQPADAGRGDRRLARRRHGLLRGRHRRRWSGIVACAAGDVLQRGRRDAQLPSSQGRSDGSVPRLE